MIDSLTESYRNAIVAIGEDPGREGLLDTPKRAAKALEFLTSGYRQDLETVVNGAVFESENDEMVVVRDVELYSMCEHHMRRSPGGAISAIYPTVKCWGCQSSPGSLICSPDGCRFRRI